MSPLPANLCAASSHCVSRQASAGRSSALTAAARPRCCTRWRGSAARKAARYSLEINRFRHGRREPSRVSSARCCKPTTIPFPAPCWTRCSSAATRTSHAGGGKATTTGGGGGGGGRRGGFWLLLPAARRGGARGGLLGGILRASFCYFAGRLTPPRRDRGGAVSG